MSEFVRVKIVGTTAEASVSLEQVNANPAGFEVLDHKPAVHPDGTPLPTKYKTSVSSEAAKHSNMSGLKAASPKENS